MPLAILCSGQGNQHAGMFNLTADSPATEDLFGVASDPLADAIRGSWSRQAAQQISNRTAPLKCFASLRR
jgi:[acyl-carrier-protein] S-malonyltransferase